MNQTDWAQKYRPTSIDDLALPPTLGAKIRTYIQTGAEMSLLFYGPPGCGKTTAARLINPDETYFVNCTMDNSIGMVREMERKCSSVTLTGSKRVVVLDEAEYLSRDAQAALRGLVETHSAANCFVMTANEPERLSDAMLSRFYPVAFDFLQSTEFRTSLLARLGVIAASEGHPDVPEFHLKSIVSQCFPDIRKMIKALQFELIGSVPVQ